MFGSVIISSVTAFYTILKRGYIFPLVPSSWPWLRILWLFDYSAFVLLVVGFLVLKPPSLAPLARRMVTVVLFESVALTAVSALAPWVGTDRYNHASIGVYSVALVAALALVLREAWRKHVLHGPVF